jgi:hypothetical protein
MHDVVCNLQDKIVYFIVKHWCFDVACSVLIVFQFFRHTVCDLAGDHLFSSQDRCIRHMILRLGFMMEVHTQFTT